MNLNQIPIHSPKEFDGMRKAGALAASILDKLKNIIKPGISTEEINEFCHKIIIKLGEELTAKIKIKINEKTK